MLHTFTKRRNVSLRLAAWILTALLMVPSLLPLGQGPAAKSIADMGAALGPAWQSAFVICKTLNAALTPDRSPDHPKQTIHDCPVCIGQVSANSLTANVDIRVTPRYEIATSWRLPDTDNARPVSATTAA